DAHRMRLLERGHGDFQANAIGKGKAKLSNLYVSILPACAKKIRALELTMENHQGIENK
ncbi:hypothetical protein KI387_036675, partial [Taxus chinensis]